MGYLYYGNYAMLYEIGRSESIRELGISYKVLEDEYRIMMPVIFVESRYLMPIKYDELINIKTILDEMPGKLIHFKHEIFNEANELCHKGEVKLFFVDINTNKRVSTPDYLSTKLLPYFEYKNK